MERIVDTIDITIAAKRTDIKLSICIPGTTKDASHKTKALTTKVNNPKVKRLIGKVIKIKIGLMNTLITPITTAARSPVVKLAI